MRVTGPRTVVAIPWWIVILFFPIILAGAVLVLAFYVIGFIVMAIVKLVQYLVAQHHPSQTER